MTTTLAQLSGGAYRIRCNIVTHSRLDIQKPVQKVDAKQQIAKYMSNFLGTCWFKKGKGKSRVKLTNSKLSDVTAQLSYLDEVYLKPSQSAPCWINGRTDAKDIIAAKNCLVNMTNKETMPLTDDFYTTNYMPYDYNPEAFSEKWGDFLTGYYQQ